MCFSENEEKIISKLKIIKVSGDKGTIYNYEAAIILDIINSLLDFKEASIRNMAINLNNDLNKDKKHKEDLEALNEGWKVEVEKLTQEKDKMIDEILNSWKQDDIKNIEELKEYFKNKIEYKEDYKAKYKELTEDNITLQYKLD